MSEKNREREKGRKEALIDLADIHTHIGKAVGRELFDGINISIIEKCSLRNQRRFSLCACDLDKSLVCPITSARIQLFICEREGRSQEPRRLMPARDRRVFVFTFISPSLPLPLGKTAANKKEMRERDDDDFVCVCVSCFFLSLSCSYVRL